MGHEGRIVDSSSRNEHVEGEESDQYVFIINLKTAMQELGDFLVKYNNNRTILFLQQHVRK